MNPNWTGRAARTLSECRFTDDANPFDRSHKGSYPTAWWVSICIVSLLAVVVIVRLGA